MKNFFSALLILISGTSFSQTVYFGAGYNLATGGFDDLNDVIDRYNETRTWLGTPMENLNITKGTVFSFGMAPGGFIYEFGIQYNRAKTFAKGVDNTQTEQQRDLYLRLWGLYMDFGFPVVDEGVSVAPGFGWDLTTVKYLTRVAPPDQIKDVDKTKSDSELGMHVRFFVKIALGGFDDGGAGLMIEPYYSLGLMGADLTDLNKELNSNTWQNDPEDLKEKYSYFGVRLMFLLKAG
ncbi:MAG: hypothetical protein JXA03_04885 [Bacteroidales bacterium]|nr:hypothetical protein [Bacteroidales bacterium]